MGDKRMTMTPKISRRKAITYVGAAGLSVPSLVHAQGYKTPGVYIEENPSTARDMVSGNGQYQKLHGTTV